MIILCFFDYFCVLLKAQLISFDKHELVFSFSWMGVTTYKL